MRVLVSGSSGLVGSALVTRLRRVGHEVFRLVRRPSAAGDELSWDPTADRLPESTFQVLQRADAVVHLAGENIAAGRWTTKRRERIYESRVGSTTVLAEAIAASRRKPKVFLCASAVGYYGDRGDEVLDEQSAPGRGFLPHLCCQWEAACEPARTVGVRVVNMRFGVVLSNAGGMLARVVPLFRWGLGGPLGSGRQYVSWITLDDLLEACLLLLEADQQAGPVNLVAPNPVTNRRFTCALASVLHRPAFLPVPGVVLRILLGQMARELLLASTRVVPHRLQEAGFMFRHLEIDSALRAALGTCHKT